MCQAIYEHYHESAFKCPTTAEEWTQVAQDFSDKWNFHHCCGGIDGKHVRIQAPPNSGCLYYNYKGFYFIIMLALVDANYKFMYVDVGLKGLILMLKYLESLDYITLWTRKKLGCHQVHIYQMVTLMSPTFWLVMMHFHWEAGWWNHIQRKPWQQQSAFLTTGYPRPAVLWKMRLTSWPTGTYTLFISFTI